MNRSVSVIACVALIGGIAIASPMVAWSADNPSPPPAAQATPAPAPAPQSMPQMGQGRMGDHPGMGPTGMGGGMRGHGTPGDDEGMGRMGMGGMMGGPGMMREHHWGRGPMGHGWGMMREGKAHRTPAERCTERVARRAGMVAYTVAKLDLTAEQRPIWDKLNAIIEAGSAKEQQLCAALKTAGTPAGQQTVLDRVDRREKFLSTHLQTLQQARPVLEQLYKALSPEQKEIIDHPFHHG